MKLEELLRDEGVRIMRPGEHHHARQGWLQLDCPFCGKGSSKFHMGLSMNGGTFVCYKCGKLDRLQTIAALLDVTDRRAISMLKGVSYSTEANPRQSAANPRHSLVLPKGRGELKKAHVDYLRKRGFDVAELVRIWKIEGIGGFVPLQWRIFIPMFLNGKMVSWTTRAISKEAKLRYISAGATQEIVNHKTLLYGEDLCGNTICIVEGPISAWAIGPGAVATCGLGFTRPQLTRMAKYPRRLVCFDSERTAQRRAKQLCDALSVFPGTTENILLDAKDPAESSPKEIKSLRMIIRS